MSIEVSPQMRENNLVLGLEELLGNRLIFTRRALPEGYLFKADAQGPRGFSLKARVPSHLLADQPILSRPVLWIQGYPSEPVCSHPQCTLQEYFGHVPAVTNYVSFLERIGEPEINLTNAEPGRRVQIGHYSLLSDNPEVMRELTKLLLALVVS